MKNDTGILLIAMIVFAVLLVVLVSCSETLFQDERLIPYWDQCPCKREVSLTVERIDKIGAQYLNNTITFHPAILNHDKIKLYGLMAHEIGHSIGKDHSKKGDPEWHDPGMELGRWFTIDNEKQLEQMYFEICDY